MTLKKLGTYLFRAAVLISSLYFLGNEIWYGTEGLEQCQTLRNEIAHLETKRTRLLTTIQDLDYQLSFLNDPEFSQEYVMRENDLKQKGDIVYLI